MYILNKSNSTLILMGGSIRLAPAGEPGSFRALSLHAVGHPDLYRDDVEVVSESEYVQRYTANLSRAESQKVNPQPEIVEAPEEIVEEPETAVVPEEIVEEPETAVVPEEIVEEPARLSLEDFKALDFGEKKDLLRDLGLDPHVKLTSNKNVDAGYAKYLAGGFDGL